MKIKENLKRLLMIFVVIINIINLVRLPIPYRVGFDKSIAEDLIKEAYKPMVDFVKSGTPVEDAQLLLVSNEIRNEEDFIKLFNNKVDNDVAEGFFEDLVINEQGVLYIDKRVYIPNIYAEDSKVTNSYIKKYTRSLYSIISSDNDLKEERLVIKEKIKISGEWHRRSNHFFKNDDGNWILHHSTGTGKFKFVDASHNPWSYN